MVGARKQYIAGSNGTPKPSYVGVEVKRRATMESLEQLTRYLEWLNKDPYLPGGVRGILVAMDIPPAVKKEAWRRGIGTVVVDYEALQGKPTQDLTLF